MPTMNIIQAVNDALQIQMRQDDRVVVLGEDVGKFGGVFRATSGLQKEFGVERVIDTPLAETGIIATAIGMAINGLRPVAEIQFADYMYPAFDQIVNEMAKFRYRSGGQYTCPVVVRTPYGGGIKGGHYHSQSNEAYWAHTSGLKVVIPATPEDAKGLLLASMRQDDPVIFMEPKRMYRAGRGEVPTGDYTIELGKAKIVRPGSQVTVIAYGSMTYTALEAAAKAEAMGMDPEVIDLRSIVPLDIDTIIKSVEKTGRVVIVQEAPKTGGFAAEIMALINEKALMSLEAPMVRVTGWDTPFPYTLDLEYLPSAERVVEAMQKVINF
ncbi:2-oxoisovalerate dehydrogenase subunit beta [compost metagenome]